MLSSGVLSCCAVLYHAVLHCAGLRQAVLSYAMLHVVCAGLDQAKLFVLRLSCNVLLCSFINMLLSDALHMSRQSPD